MLEFLPVELYVKGFAIATQILLLLRISVIGAHVVVMVVFPLSQVNLSDTHLVHLMPLQAQSILEARVHHIKDIEEGGEEEGEQGGIEQDWGQTLSDHIIVHFPTVSHERIS